MKSSEVISKMEEEGINSLAHITIDGCCHRYYVDISYLKKLQSDMEIEILSTEVKSLHTQDVVGRGPRNNNKKRLYNVR